jgi:pyruvate dehydrogenase E2 component (dihydrolipoamide acetyltransferase)
MAITIEMPKLSDTMSVGTVVKWHKQVGDQVENGDTLAEIETDKATMELENFDDGVLLKILVEEGAEAPIGSPLAIVGEEGESIEEIDTQAIEETVLEEKPEPISSEKTDDSSNLSAEKNLEVTTAEPASLNELKDNETKAEDPPGKKVNTSSDRIFVSPLAKKMADEKNIDLANIKGSGPSGRIIKKDILATEVSHSDKNHDPVLPANVSRGTSGATNPIKQ